MTQQWPNDPDFYGGRPPPPEAPSPIAGGGGGATQVLLKFGLTLFYHPYACLFLNAVRRHGVDGLLRPMRLPATSLSTDESSLASQMLAMSELMWERAYGPNPVTVSTPWPVDEIEFGTESAFGQYNWEIFFHAPMLIAGRLTALGRYSEAREWYHVVFDPTVSVPSERVPAGLTLPGVEPANWWQSAWKFRPFVEIASSSWGVGGDLEGFEEVSAQFAPGSREWNTAVRTWREDPFDPHGIARVRLVSYQRQVLMRYLDNLIAWGDSEFRKDSLESIQEAAQLYLHAFDLLGPRPLIPSVRPKPAATTFGDLIDPAGSQPSDGSVQLEGLIGARVLETFYTKGDVLSPATAWLFCVPSNDRLFTYWDTVEDRLFKIRNSLNIDGVFRLLPLFAPPIDPAALVAAAAAGVPLADAIAGLTAPPPQHRFLEMHRRALELANEVRGLGQSLLSALEKEDAEALAVLRQEHDRTIQELSTEVRNLQTSEAREQLAGAKQAEAIATSRRDHYGELVDKGLTADEEQARKLMEKAQEVAKAVGFIGVVSAVLIAIGELFMPSTGPRPTGQGMALAIQIGQVIQTDMTMRSQLASNKAGDFRREQEWKFARDQAEDEISQAQIGVRAAQMRVDISDKELENQRVLSAQSEEVLTFLKAKYTNVQLYTWLSAELRKIHRKALDLALEVARKAQAAYRFELADPGATFLGPSYTPGAWGHLVAAEKLIHDLHRMSTTYVERHGREIELIKQVSLADLDPVALLMLRQSGSCYFDVPEAVFDLDAPGTYDRRVHMIDVTVQCTRDPRTSIPMKVSMTSSQIRKSASVAEGYLSTGIDDGRFVRGPRAPQTIWLSHGRNDTGTFDGRDDLRYMPFENEGVISSWALGMPAGARPFDYGTLSDVVITFRYKAKDGGFAMREQAQASLVASWEGVTRALRANGRLTWMTASQEAPEAWQAFLDGNETLRTLSFTASDALLPEWLATQGGPDVVQLLVVVLDGVGTATIELTKGASVITGDLRAEPSLGGAMLCRLDAIGEPFTGSWTLAIDGLASARDIVLIFLFDV